MTGNEKCLLFVALAFLAGKGTGGFHLFGGSTQARPIVVPPHPAPIVPTGVPVSATSTAFHFGEAVPSGLPPFPGPGWTAAHVTGSIASRAQVLLHSLPMNATKYETSPDQGPIAYHKGPLHPDGSGMMVTAWRLRHPSEVAT